VKRTIESLAVAFLLAVSAGVGFAVDVPPADPPDTIGEVVGQICEATSVDVCIAVFGALAQVCATADNGACEALGQILGPIDDASQQIAEAREEGDHDSDLLPDDLEDTVCPLHVPQVEETFCCPHDACTTGAALHESCGACANTVCTVGGGATDLPPDAFCCDVEWDDQCVSEAGELCGGCP
jgi:hypothetical protein